MVLVHQDFLDFQLTPKIKNKKIISIFDLFVVFNTKLQGRSILDWTHKCTWHRRQKQLSPIVTVSNEITKAVRSDNAVFTRGKTRPQPVPMSDIRGLWQQVCKEAGLLDVRYETPASLITARQQRRQATVHECRVIRPIMEGWSWSNYITCILYCMLVSCNSPWKTSMCGDQSNVVALV